MVSINYLINLGGFYAWDEGQETLDALTPKEIDSLDKYLSIIHPEAWEEEELNTYLATKRDWIAKNLGYNNWNEIIERDKYNC